MADYDFAQVETAAAPPAPQPAGAAAAAPAAAPPVAGPAVELTAVVLPGALKGAIDGLNVPADANLILVFCVNALPAPTLDLAKARAHTGLLGALLQDNTALGDFFTEPFTGLIIINGDCGTRLATCWLRCDVAGDHPGATAFWPVGVRTVDLQQALKQCGTAEVDLTVSSHSDVFSIQGTLTTSGASLWAKAGLVEMGCAPVARAADASPVELVQSLGSCANNLKVINSDVVGKMALSCVVPPTVLLCMVPGDKSGDLMLALSDVDSTEHTNGHVRCFTVEAREESGVVGCSSSSFGDIAGPSARTVNVARPSTVGGGQAAAAAAAAETDDFLNADDGGASLEPPAKRRRLLPKHRQRTLPAVYRSVQNRFRRVPAGRSPDASHARAVRAPMGMLTARAGVSVSAQLLHDAIAGCKNCATVTLCMGDLDDAGECTGLGIVSQTNAHCLLIQCIGEKVGPQLPDGAMTTYRTPESPFVQHILLAQV